MEVKYKKGYLRLRLKDLYLNILAKEDEALKFGKPYIWFVQALWKLKETILPNNLSKLLDQKGYEYFMEVNYLLNAP